MSTLGIWRRSLAPPRPADLRDSGSHRRRGHRSRARPTARRAVYRKLHSQPHRPHESGDLPVADAHFGRPQPRLHVAVAGSALWLLVAHYDNPATGTPTNNHLTLIDLRAATRSRRWRCPIRRWRVIVRRRQPGVGGHHHGISPVQPGIEQRRILLETIANSRTNPVTRARRYFPAGHHHRFGLPIGRRHDDFRRGRLQPGHYVSLRRAVANRVPGGIVLANGILGPRVVSLNQDGSVHGRLDHAEARASPISFPKATNQFSVGTSLFDDSRGLIYAQIPAAWRRPPVLQVLAEDNLTVLQKLRLPENTKGKSVFNPQSNVMYSISDSGVLVLPVGYSEFHVAGHRFGPQPVLPRKFLRQQHHLANLDGNGSGRRAQRVQLSSRPPGVTVSPAAGSRPRRLPSRSIPRRSPACTELRRWTWDSPRRRHQRDRSGAACWSIIPIPTSAEPFSKSPERWSTFWRIRFATVITFCARITTPCWSSTGPTTRCSRPCAPITVPTTMAISFDHQYIYIGHDDSADPGDL